MLWRIIWTKSANDKIVKCTCGNASSTPLHNLYDTHENSIPFLHRDLAAAHFTSLSLLNRETYQMFGRLSLKRSHYSGRISHGYTSHECVSRRRVSHRRASHGRISWAGVSWACIS